MIESPPTKDSFFSAKLRLARANEHLDDLETKILEFFAKDPFAHLVELDADGIHAIHKIQMARAFPTNWCLLATEIIEHIRASLDHAVYVTRTVDGTLCAAFPFSETPAKLDNRVRGLCKDTPPEIQTLLRGFDCYRGGNDLLHALNDLSNSSKHGLIMLIAGATHSGEITGTGASWGGGVQFFEPLKWDRAKNEIKYARTKRGVDFQHKAVIRVYVALDGTKGISLESVTSVLNAMLQEAARIVSAIQQECIKHGLDV